MFESHERDLIKGKNVLLILTDSPANDEIQSKDKGNEMFATINPKII